MNIRPNKFVEALEAYEITPQQPWLDYESEDVLKLDWNEGNNVPAFVQEVAFECLCKKQFFAWYPDYSAIELHEKLSLFLGVSAHNVLSFPGSDVALETICRAYLEPGDRTVVVTPGYDNFDVYAKSSGSDIIKFNLAKPFRFNVDYFISEIFSVSPKIIYLASPNNPCGYVIGLKKIQRICREFPATLVICDQAYVEFSPDFSCVPLIQSCANLVIVRTFSKAFSLAGIRLGYVVASHKVLKVLAKLRNGKNITMLSQKIAIAVINRFDQLEIEIRKVNLARDWLKDQLIRSGITVYESYANFLLFEIPDSIKLILELKRNNIYVRDKTRSTGGCLRVTVTGKDSAEKFYSIVRKVVRLEHSPIYEGNVNLDLNL